MYGLFTQILRIYWRIGRNVFHCKKWYFQPNENSVHTKELCPLNACYQIMDFKLVGIKHMKPLISWYKLIFILIPTPALKEGPSFMNSDKSHKSTNS